MLGYLRPSDDTEYQENRMNALLALTVSAPLSVSICPSDTQIAAFIDKRLNTGEYQAVLKHLNTCPDCYSQWLDVTDMLEEKSRDKSLVWERLSIGVMLAAAACLILFLAWPLSLGTRISQSYQTVLGQKMTFSPDKKSRMLAMPWQIPGKSYGFAASPRNAPVYRAFGAGLWTGARTLAQEQTPSVMPDFLSPKQGKDPAASDNWKQMPWAVYFDMGQWGFLVRAAALSDSEVPHYFWKLQKSIVGELQAEFEKSEKNRDDVEIVNLRLGNIGRILQDAGQQSPDKKQRLKIAYELDMLIDHLGPAEIGVLK